VQVDALLARVERTAVLVCVIMTVAAAVLARGRIMPPVAVLAGGLLAWVSYRSILSTAGALADRVAGTGAEPLAGSLGANPQSDTNDPAASGGNGQLRPVSPVLAGVKVAARYALLALLAYVMIARLRLPPLGLLAGASSVVAAVSIEAIRFLVNKTP
jgi:hypothetical protein